MLQQRSVGLTECYSKLCHDKANCATNLVGMIQLSGVLTIEGVSQALEKMQTRFPALRSYWGEWNDKSGKLVVDQESKNIPLKKMNRNDDNQWRDVVEQHMIMPFGNEERYLWRVTVLLDKEDRPATHEIIVSFLHTISDGISTASFFNELLYLLNHKKDTAYASEKNLPFLPPVESMLEKSTRWMGFLYRNIVKSFTFMTMKQLNRYEQFVPVEKRTPKIECRVIEKTALSRLLKKCNNENTTLTAFLTASLALAVYECSGYSEKNRKLKQVTATPVSIRKDCNPVIDDHIIGCFVNFYRTIHVIDLKTDLWELARSYKTQLDGAINDNGNMPPATFSEKILINIIDSFNSGFLKNIFPYGIGVTNIGYVPFQRQSGAFQIEKFYFGTSRNLGDWLTLLHVATVGDRLFLGFCYATPLVSEKTAAKMAGRVISTVNNI